MEVDAVILADAVSTPPGESKFYVHGGGFSRYEVPGVPFPVPLGVLIRLRIEPDEEAVAHHFKVALIGPTGLPNVPPAEFEFPPLEGQREDLLEGEERFIHIGLRIAAVIVRLGLYHLNLEIDGQLLRSVPLPVKLMEGGVPPPPDDEGEWPGNGHRQIPGS
jgi:hypothetical protein